MKHELEPKPIFPSENSSEFKALINSKDTTVIDYFDNMAAELAEIRKISNSSKKIGFGVWVYYPWSKHLIKILNKDDFQELRTARNKNITTPEEQEKFRKTVVGIAGLSIGNSAALSIAYTGGSETLKLADPDFLDGSNLNRIRAGLKNLGENKTYIAAKQIYELNPYANLILYPEGLNENNLKDFLVGKPEIDIIVEEMDNLKLKVFIRLLARATKKPLVMATDNGDNIIIDVDRFDLNPNLPPFDTLPAMDVDTIVENLNYGEKLELTTKERVLLATNLVGPENISTRMQESLMEVGNTLVSWPQPATSAFTSGSVLSFIVKSIATGQNLKTGKTNLSLEKTFLQDFESKKSTKVRTEKTKEFVSYVKQLSQETLGNNYSVWNTSENDFPKNKSLEEQIKFILNYAIMAPSTHNTQPWNFKIQNEKLYLLADFSRALPVSDPTKREMYISLGTVVTNILVAATYFGLDPKVNRFPKGEDGGTVAEFIFNNSEKPEKEYSQLFTSLSKRLSNRGPYEKKLLSNSFFNKLNKLTRPEDIVLSIVDKKNKISKIADLVFEGTTSMMGNGKFRNELSQWLRHNFTKSGDGMPGFTLELNNIQSIIGQFLIKSFDLGSSQAKTDSNLINSSPALVVISSKANNPKNWLEVGELYEKIVLLATLNKVSNATMASVIELGGLPSKLSEEIGLNTIPQVFFRLGYSKHTVRHSPRRNVEDTIVT